MPGRDASDLWMLLRHYADAGNQDRLYGQEGEAAFASFGFDLDKAGAWLLGSDAREVLAHGPDPRASLQSLDTILKPEIDPDGVLRLVAQMPPGDHDRQLALVTAFYAASSKPVPRRRESGTRIAGPSEDGLVSERKPELLSRFALVDSHCHIDMVGVRH